MFQKNLGKSLAGILAAIFLFMACAGSPGVDPSLLASAEPGTIEINASGNMPKVIAASKALDIADDEAVIYYYRDDRKYDQWGFWLWRYGDGDGSTNWEKSSVLSESNGVGYFRFKQDGSDVAGEPIVNPAGEMGFIVRGAAGWDGQTQDFIWNVATKGNEVVYFDGAAEPEAVGEYVPFFKGATMQDARTIEVTLSGKHGLELEEGTTSGFQVATLDGSESLEVVDVKSAYSPRNRKFNYTDKILISLGEDFPMGRGFRVNHPEYLAPESIDTSGLVGILADNYVPPMDYELGALYSNQSVEFRLWSPFANSVTARIFRKNLADIGRDADPDFTLELTLDPETGVWSGVFSQVDPEGMFYDYVVDTGRGVNAALDPYAKSMDAYVNEGGAGRGAIVDLSKSGPRGGWEGYTGVPLENRTDAIIYEVSVRDFTISPDSGVRGKKGTFLAFIEKLDYLKDLGVTHVQLLPVYNFYYTNELDQAYEGHGRTGDSNYNWGYDPHNHMTPEGWYSSNPKDPYSRINDFKTLIKEIHKRDMGVIMDVTFNHMGSTMLLEHIVPDYYFRKLPNGAFSSDSGVGNDFASSRTMARKLIIDALVHWAEVYKVDGFRFDLMGLIDAQTMLMAYERVSSIPGKEQILFQGEGWQMYRWSKVQDMMDQKYMDRTDSIAVFNDEVRNLLKAGGFNEEGRGLLTNKGINKEALFDNLMGRPRTFPADHPADTMAYVAAHDGLTLHDTLAHNAKIDHRTTEGKGEIAQRAKLANMLMLTNQSIVFLHAGQERGRTKPNVNNVPHETIGQFVRNSYDSADNINQIVWTLEAPFQNLLDYTKGLIQLRRATKAFRIGNPQEIEKAATHLPQEDTFSFAYKLEYGGETYFIMINASKESSTLEMGEDLSGAKVLADRMSVNLQGIADPQGLSISGSQITLEGLTPVILRK